MGKINTIWGYLGRHKYLITLIVGILLVGIVDENSFRSLALYQIRIQELQAQIDDYQKQFDNDSIRLHILMNDPKGAERIARERYLMKRPNEDIFIMSTDPKPNDN
jgi:hypothetical protein